MCQRLTELQEKGSRCQCGPAASFPSHTVEDAAGRDSRTYTDAWVPKHLARGATVPRNAGRGTVARVGAASAVTRLCRGHVTAWKVCARNFGRESVQGCLTFLVAKHILPFSPDCSKRYRTYLRRSRNALGLMKEMAGTVSARSTRLSEARVAAEAQLEAARARLSPHGH